MTGKWKWNGRSWGFITGLVLFVVFAETGAMTIQKFNSLSKWVAHTNIVIDKINRVQALAERIQTAERGFLLTRDTSTLAVFRSTRQELPVVLSEIENLVSDNPRQSALARKLVEDVSTHLVAQDGFLDRVLTGRETDFAKTIDLEAIRSIRSETDEMLDAERKLLTERSEQANKFGDWAILIIAAGTVLVVLLLGSNWFALRRTSQINENQNSLLSAILENIADGLIVIDKKGSVMKTNPAAARIMGTEISDRHAVERVKLGGLKEADGRMMTVESSPLTRALHGESLSEYELIATQHEKGERTISVDTRPMKNDSGQIFGALALFKDVTDRKSVEEEWRAAREAAIEASRLKSDFLASMSHEIRTPMNGVMGMATLLLDSKLDHEQSVYVKTIKSSADNLLTLINQILDHSKIESGMLELDRANFNLRECVDGVFSMFVYMARSKNISLDLSWDKDLPLYVSGDSARLRQILINLVGNSLKFTERGYVRLRVSSVLCSQSMHKIIFEVEDTGVGMPLEVQSRLFQKFSQVHTAAMGKGGSGLGLMIARDLVKLMKGEIGMESTSGKGSTFWFTAEFELGDESELGRNPVEPEKLGKLTGHVLVAEDQKVNQLVIEKFLERLGVTCEIANDGQAALDRMREGKFDLVFMDCQMHPMDGYAATRSIRARETSLGGGSHVPVIAITAEGRTGDKTLCFEAGMDDFLSKPIDVERLRHVLVKWLPKPPTTPDFDRSVVDKFADYSSGDAPLTQVMIGDYLRDSRDLLNRVEGALKGRDWERAKDASHALRSTSLTLGLRRVGELAELGEYHPERLNFEELRQAWEAGCALLRDYQTGQARQVS